VGADDHLAVIAGAPDPGQRLIDEPLDPALGVVCV
jgi:hypothetical protein